MFNRPIQPNSSLDEYKEEFNQFLENIKQAEIITIKEITADELKKLIDSNELKIKSISSNDEDPDAINPIKTLCGAVLDADFNSPYWTLSPSKLYHAILEDWFDRQNIILMLEGRLPEDGHDAKSDMFKFVHELAVKLCLCNKNKINPELTDIWNEFFLNKNPDVIRACQACPLIKEGNGYIFANENFLKYCSAQAIFDQAEAYMNDEKLRK